MCRGRFHRASVDVHRSRDGVRTLHRIRIASLTDETLRFCVTESNEDHGLRDVTIERIRNIAVYLVGIALATTGALGLAAAIDLAMHLGLAMFLLGIALVIVVHEFFDGPL